MLETILAGTATYLAASVSFPQLIARAHGVDLHRVGTRNLGGANLLREVGLIPGITGGLLDALKPPLAVLAAQLIGMGRDAQLGCGVLAIVGQQWPVWHRFDGGRGNAPAIAFLMAISLPAAILVAPVALAGILWGAFRRVRTRRRVYSLSTPLGLIVAFGLYPLAASWLGHADAAFAGAATTFLVVLRRLTAQLHDDLRVSGELARILVNRLLYDRTEVQRRAMEEP
jgi:glycerol-3-phosphate acyltransferase PlsY